MSKEEFLDGLQQALADNVPPAVIQENLSYYRSYINEQIQRGMAEEDVTAEIGDPRLIAKTIEDTTEGAGGSAYYQSDAYSTTEAQSQRNSRDSFSGQDGFRLFRFDKWYWKLAGIAIVLLILVIIASVFAIVAQFFVPIMIIMIIWWCINSFRRK